MRFLLFLLCGAAFAGDYNVKTYGASGGVVRADYPGGPASLPSDQRSVDHWFNTAAFV